ncbi:hypothetical protein FB451DRAFT_55520 [Mycena latifolia]|nr:hypothetical protein FB451DRAFT_55520 [Mycena latifolia]
MSRERTQLNAQASSPLGPPLAGPAAAYYRHPQPIHRGQPEPGMPYHYPPHPTGYGPFRVHAPPAEDSVDVLVQKIAHAVGQTVGQMLTAHQAQSDAKMNRLETAVQDLSTDISSGRQEARECVGLIAEVLQKSHGIQLARLKRFENILGMGPDMRDDKTLLNRFDLLSFAVEDLLERVKDPEANVPVPIHHDMATSPQKRAYADAVIPPRTPSPEPQTSSIAVGPSSPIDIFSDNSVSTAVDESIQSIAGKKLPEFDDPMDQDVVPDSPVIAHRYTPRNNFAVVSPVTGPLVPVVDWQDQSPSPRFTFNPDRSPQGMEPYTALPNQPPPSEGTIASLRQASFGDRFAGRVTSTPCRSTSVHSISPSLSVSPPQSPRQITPFRIPSHDPATNIPSPVVRPRSITPSREATPPLPHKPSVGPIPHFASAEPEGVLEGAPAPSRSTTVELEVASPSADTLREDLSVLDMMESDTPSNIVSPKPLPSMMSVVPSSVTPSPMLSAQLLRTSPPRLTLSIPQRFITPVVLPDAGTPPPGTPPGTPPQTASYPSTVDLFDTSLSPLSASTPSTPSQSPRSLSAHLQLQSPVSLSVKRERMEMAMLPTPPRTATASVLRLRPVGQASAAATRIKKRKGPPRGREPDSSPEPPLKRVRRRSEKKGAPPVNKEKGKKKKKEPSVAWPEMTPESKVDPEFVGKFVGCDNCERWYHYSCLGIVPGDPRLVGDFHCPPCTAGRWSHSFPTFFTGFNMAFHSRYPSATGGNRP